MTKIKNRTYLSFPDFTEKDEQEVASVIRRSLKEKFPTGFTFDPIYVEPRTGYDDDPYLHIYIVFDGDHNLLDPDWTGTMLGRLQPQLSALGISYRFIKSFVEKSEWEEVQEEDLL